MSRKRFGLLVSSVGLFAALGLLCWPWPVHSQLASLPVGWSAPGDDGSVGTATIYRMRASSTRPDTTTAAARDSWWASAAVCSGLPSPAIAGTAQTASVSISGGFTTGRVWYLVLRAEDEAGNLAPFSNVAWRNLPDTIPPSPVLDLRVN